MIYTEDQTGTTCCPAKMAFETIESRARHAFVAALESKAVHRGTHLDRGSASYRPLLFHTHGRCRPRGSSCLYVAGAFTQFVSAPTEFPPSD